LDKDCYLTRFAATDSARADFKHLSYLQNQHMLHIPFENLDVINGTPITMNVENYYNKIVNRRRGGFCYELNGLFNWLLQQLGYESHLIAGTVRKPDGTWALQNSHATILVKLDKPYLVDVGFGDSARTPVPFTGDEVNDVSGVYRTIPMEHKEDTYHLQRLLDGNWVTQYSVNINKKQLQDFAPMCHFNQTSPDSPFTHNEIVTIATKEGRLTFSGTALTITNGNHKTKVDISETQKDEILWKYFGIHLGNYTR